ncbi:hypothetical protein [Thermomonospora cellulosilytica]|uniref:Uncharacterized protein n=1 Tax=Thermomonospora cellulosilytica TaxID=1411118 RepID=A0A7W3N5K9_9ACTN|nr:hypothetical protein [Thermomonospora cellulosilytica]MBA9007959.1 hypothetical protein [Thermomonospora cellulosilytica]
MQIAEAAADARVFDRETVRTVADVWDNNTFPLFRVAVTGTRRGRERRARASLEWMAAAGAQRREWMVEQAAAAGYRLEPLLSPRREDAGHGRDYRGEVMPRPVPLTGEAVRYLEADYDLAGAEVRALQVERVRTRLVGSVIVAAGRRFSTGAENGPGELAELHLWLEEVTEVRFDSRDVSPVAVSVEPGGIAVSIGSRGIVRAHTATVCCDDSYWHLSTAGREADRRTPPREGRTDNAHPVRDSRRLGGAALVAATVLREAMWEIRSVRYPEYAGQVPVSAFCRVFAGAGSAVLAAGGHLRASRREEAFRRLMEEWIDRADPLMKRWFAQRLRSAADRTRLSEGTRSWLEQLASHLDSLPQPDPKPGRRRPTRAELRLASYTAAHDRYGSAKEASATVNLALPPAPGQAPDAPWHLRSLKIGGTGRFRLRTTAFHGPGDLHMVVDQGAVRSFTLYGNAFTVTAGYRDA